MMIYWIILLISTVIWLWIAVVLLILNNKTLKKLNDTLTTEVVKTKKAPIIIWRITKYEDKELDLLLSNPDLIDLLLKIFEYKIAKKTDTIRELKDTEKKVWYLDCLHETHLYFYKLKQKLNKKWAKGWANLV